jgi:hypothetical protein
MLIQSILLIVVGYLLGSVSPTYLVGRWLGGKDLRQYGGGTLGGSLVNEHVGSWAVVLVVVYDIGNAALPAFLALWLGLGVPVAAAAAGLSAGIGHNWSIFAIWWGAWNGDLCRGLADSLSARRGLDVRALGHRLAPGGLGALVAGQSVDHATAG